MSTRALIERAERDGRWRHVDTLRAASRRVRMHRDGAARTVAVDGEVRYRTNAHGEGLWAWSHRSDDGWSLPDGEPIYSWHQVIGTCQIHGDAVRDVVVEALADEMA